MLLKGNMDCGNIDFQYGMRMNLENGVAITVTHAVIDNVAMYRVSFMYVTPLLSQKRFACFL